MGVRYAMTVSGDETFLTWALRTRRGAGVVCEDGEHCVALVYLDDQYAAILDNNSPGTYRWMSRQDFLADWHQSGGWAFSLVMGSPAAPLAE
jgi:hypothetical protein